VVVASYGSTLRYKSLQKIHKVNDSCMIGISGEVSDYQHIQEILGEMSMDDFCADDGIELTPSEIYSILCRVLYNRRTKMDPLWNSVVVCGMQNGVPFIGSVGMLGTHYVDDHVTTGHTFRSIRGHSFWVGCRNGPQYHEANTSREPSIGHD